MTKTTKAKQVAKTVLVRTYSAGVHVGTLGARSGDEVELTNARRIWRWKGGNTLHEIALHGPGRGSQVSETATCAPKLYGYTDSITLTISASR